MRIYNLKYRKLAFIIDTLSLLGFLAVILFASLAIFLRHSWLYTSIAAGVFVFLKLLSKYLLSIRVARSDEIIQEPEIKTVITEEPAATRAPTPEELNNEIFASQYSEIKQTRRQQTRQPGKLTNGKKPKPVIQKKIIQKKAAKRVSDLDAEIIPTLNSEVVPTLETIVSEPAPDLNFQFDCYAIKQEHIGAPRANSTLVTSLDLENSTLSCCIDNQGIALTSVDPFGSPFNVCKCNRKNIHTISFGRLRNEIERSVKIFNYVIGGLILGIIICIGIIGHLYFEHNQIVSKTYAVTTLLPILAAATFIGLILGIIRPQKKSRTYMLYRVHTKNEDGLCFVIEMRSVKQTNKILINAGFALNRL